MIYILMVATLVSGGGGGMFITTQEFNNKDACEHARLVTINEMTKWWGVVDSATYRVRVFCVMKGTK